MSLSVRNWRRSLMTLSVMCMFLVPLQVSLADGPAEAGDDRDSRAQGAEDVGNVPGKINYYKDGYPLKPNVIYTMNLSFSIERDANHNEVLGYIGRVNNFHARFYDGTDGQMAIERVDVWNNKRMWNNIDVRFYTQNGRAFTFRGGISSEDAYIYMFGGDSGKVLHHEWGHYAMFLPDEYTDSGGAFCTCIMGTCWNTDEYCCDSNHNYNHAYSESRSCWQQIVDRYDHVTEKDPPTSGPWDEPPITYIWHELLDLETKDSNMTIFPSSPTKGDDLFVNVSFYNLNYSVAGNQKFTLFDGNPDTGGVALESKMFDVSGEEEFTISWKRKAVEGMNDLWVVADPNNTVTETNENNNRANGKVYVNVPPAIDPGIPGTFYGYEDQSIEVDLTDYELDVEDTNAELVWTILDYDNQTIVDLQEDLAEDNFVFTPLENWFGTTTVDARLTDTVGAYIDVSFKLDFESVNDLPSVTEFDRDLDTILRGGSVNIVMRGEDIETLPKQLTPEIEYKTPTGDWTGLQVSFNDGFRTTMSTDHDSILGSYHIRGRVVDAHDGESDWVYLNDSVNVTNNVPTIMGIVIPEDVLYRTETITIQVAAEDLEDDPADLVWDIEMQDPEGEWGPIDGDLTYGLGYHQFDFAPDEGYMLGAYRFRGRAWDADGDTTGWLEDATDVIVMNNLPEIGGMDVPVTEIYRTGSFDVSATGNDIEEEMADLVPEFQYSFGQAWNDAYLGDPTYDTSDEGWKVTFTAPAGSPLGGVKFKARFTDADGDSSDWMESTPVQVRNNVPVAIMTGPTEGKVGEELYFFGSNSSDVEGEVNYAWNFGDGQTSTQADPLVKFRRAGTFDVTMTVKDPNGMTDNEAMTVKISKKPSPPPSIIDAPGRSTLFGGLGLIGLLAVIAIIVVIIVIAAVMMRKRRESGPPLDEPPPSDAPAAGGFVPLTEAIVPDEPGPVEGPPPPGPPDPGPGPESGPPTEDGPDDGPSAEEKKNDGPPPGPPKPGPPTSSDSPSS